MEVAQIYQAIQYQPVSCFKQFDNTISYVRLEGDLEANWTIKREAIKLLGKAVLF